MTHTDQIYCRLLTQILRDGERIQSRNGETLRCFTLPTVVFTETPLVTLRKTAWQKAIREMEWFLSGDTKCPDELLGWWDGQLNNEGRYLAGYGHQLRAYQGWFDQFRAFLEGLITHPYSRRHILSTWNPVEMPSITTLNNNPKAVSTCHSTLVQFFVSPTGELSMHSYQRSADMLLGVPHNWIQSWALLLWIAEQCSLVADQMLWTFGDAHIYTEPSHQETAIKIIEASENTLDMAPRLEYTGNEQWFSAKNFQMIGTIHSPVVNTRPILLC